MPTISTARQLEEHRTELGDDYQFVMRCQDDAYGRLVRDVAIDVIARDTIDGDDPGAIAIADAIIDEVRQTKQDALPIAA